MKRELKPWTAIVAGVLIALYFGAYLGVLASWWAVLGIGILLVVWALICGLVLALHPAMVREPPKDKEPPR